MYQGDGNVLKKKPNMYRNALRRYAASKSKLFDLMHAFKPKLYGFNAPPVHAALKPKMSSSCRIKSQEFFKI
jgi:hypothetical protein